MIDGSVVCVYIFENIRIKIFVLEYGQKILILVAVVL
jgi:hypothetical protein